MKSVGALEQIEALLRREGRGDLVDELKRVSAAGDAAEAYTRTFTEVTRALLENERTYRTVFANELDPLLLFELETGAILDVNEPWSSLYGYTREEALAMQVCALSAEPDVVARANASGWTGETKRVNVRWHKTKDGAVFPIELTSGKLTLGDRPVAYAFVRDITHRQKAERQLEISGSHFKALIESMPDGVVVHHFGPVVYLNPSARRMLGYAPDDPLAGMKALDLVHPDDRETILARISYTQRTGETTPALEQKLLRKDGTLLLAEVAAIRTVFEGEPAMLAILRDVSARREHEAQIVLNDRLAALGRLAASVGHELNNPLGYILGNLELVQHEVSRIARFDAEAAERLAQHLGMIREGASRMRDIVRDLRTLGRADAELVTNVHLEGILEVCAKMAEREIVARARLVRDFGGRTLVHGSEARVGQVFLNLLLNAAQAIPEGSPGDNEVCVAVRGGGDGRVCVEVRDTGAGIAPENHDRIFEPFFTTKHGQGTGLGLSICHRIVTAAGGTLTAHANEGRGAVFRVVLPIVEEP